MFCISIYLSVFRQIYLANEVRSSGYLRLTVDLICCGGGGAWSRQEPPETSVR